MENFDLVVASHLRWDFVWQRPQQILSRLAHNHRVLFVEEPVFCPDGEEPEGELRIVNSTLAVLRPQVKPDECCGTPLSDWPCEDRITSQVREAMRRLNYRSYA